MVTKGVPGVHLGPGPALCGARPALLVAQHQQPHMPGDKGLVLRLWGLGVISLSFLLARGRARRWRGRALAHLHALAGPVLTGGVV